MKNRQNEAQGRVIVITGVASGLGWAMVERFAGLGHRVLGCGRSSEKVSALSKRHPADHRFSVVDVASDAAVQQWALECLKSAGSPDLLINNAAVINPNAPLWKVPAKEFSDVMDINVKGTANVIRHFVPSMIERGSGVIVNISSGWGRSTDAEVAPYCASKWAIEGLTQALSRELPSGLAAIPLNPGIINTEMLQSSFGAASSRYPSAAEWAEIAVPFLLKLNSRDNGKQLTVPIRGAND